MINKQKIYVAGPYTHGDVMENIQRAIEMGDRLMVYGFIPFIPHLTGFWHLMFPHPYDEWMSYDEEWLKSCDAVLRISGESNGADAEVLLARKLNIPVFYTDDNVYRYFFEVS